MTFLAPFLLGAAAVAALGVTLAHLLAKRRPRAVPWATTRFLPQGDLDARALTTRPRDPWLLALRLAIVALLGLGLAQPVPREGRVALRRVLLLDARASAAARDSAVRTLDARDAVLDFDTTVTLAAASAWRAPADTARGARPSRLGGALAALARVRDSLARDADSLAVTLVSPLHEDLVDAGTPAVRALVPDAIAIVRAAPAVAPRDTQPAPVRIEGATDDDPLAASLASLGALPGGGRVRVTDVGTAPRAGSATTHVTWLRAAADAPATPDAVLLDDGTAWVAPLVRTNAPTSVVAGARVVARWADGAPAAVERRGPDGTCERAVAIGIPVAGDVALTVAARRAIARLVRPCDLPAPAIDARAVASLAAAPPRATVAQRAVLAGTERSPWAPWLVGGAALLALLEPVLRRLLAARTPEPRDG